MGGKLPDDWVIVRLSDFTSLQRGHDLPEYKRKPGKIPVMGSFGITGYHDTPIKTGPGVTIGRSGASFGVVNYTPLDYWPHNTVLYVTDFHGNDERFAYYCLKNIDFKRYNSGSAQPSLNRNYIHPIKVIIPPLPEQKAIAYILGTLDDKIELNHKTNRTLEAIARAIFKSWFIDFDPVRAKMNGRQPDGIDDKTAALFPDSFEDSELGPIPKGWGVGKIKDIVTIKRNTIKPRDYNNEVFLHHSIPAFDEGKSPILEYGHDIGSNKYIIPEEAVLISRLNPRFRRVWVPRLTEGYRSICSTEFFVTVPNDGYSTEYTFSLLTDPGFSYTFETLVTGTSGSHQRVKKEYFSEMVIVIPPTEIIQSFSDIIKPVIDSIALLITQSETLGNTRDTLLPKLVSGEIRVKDAEKFVEERS
jgi:type I restriction enzyme S subunit